MPRQADALLTLSPRSFPFWTNPRIRPKRNFEALFIFPDMIFGGEGNQMIDPHLVKSFSRPGYTEVGTQRNEYQLRTGDYAQVFYQTQSFATKALTVSLIDVGGHRQGADTAAAIQTSLAMLQKTMAFEQEAAASEEGMGNKKYNKMINTYSAYPRMFFILELNAEGEEHGAWEIWDPVLTSVAFSDVDYQGAESLATVDLTFSYNNFKYDQNWGKRQLKSRLQTIADSHEAWLTNTLANASDWWSAQVAKLGGSTASKSTKPAQAGGVTDPSHRA
jgi:hypothetical protein